MYSIRGFGMNQPFNKGVEIATTKDKGYAEDIASAMAAKHIGQYFGAEGPNGLVDKLFISNGVVAV